MNLPAEGQWACYSALCARLRPLPVPECDAVLHAPRATGEEDPQVLSLVAMVGFGAGLIGYGTAAEGQSENKEGFIYNGKVAGSQNKNTLGFFYGTTAGPQPDGPAAVDPRHPAQPHQRSSGLPVQSAL